MIIDEIQYSKYNINIKNKGGNEYESTRKKLKNI